MNSGPAQPYYHRDDFDGDFGHLSGEKKGFWKIQRKIKNFTVADNPTITFVYLSGINTSTSEVFACSNPYIFFSPFL
jgi:hypothetical protein